MDDNKNNQRQVKLNNSNLNNSSKNANFDKNIAKTAPKHQNNTNIMQTNTKTNTHTNKETITQTKDLSSRNSFSKEDDTPQSSTQNQNKKQPSPTSKDAKKHKVITALIFIGGTIILGIIATLLGGKMREGYIKPPAYPPDWLFSVVWPILYIMIGIASFLAFKSVEENKKRRDDVIWYSIHLFFNFLWPLFYFRLDMLIFSCIWLVFNVISAIIVTYRYYRANLCSGILFTIYTMWLIFALYLSLGITMLNLM